MYPALHIRRNLAITSLSLLVMCGRISTCCPGERETTSHASPSAPASPDTYRHRIQALLERLKQHTVDVECKIVRTHTGGHVEEVVMPLVWSGDGAAVRLSFYAGSRLDGDSAWGDAQDVLITDSLIVVWRHASFPGGLEFARLTGKPGRTLQARLQQDADWSGPFRSIERVMSIPGARIGAANDDTATIVINASDAEAKRKPATSKRSRNPADRVEIVLSANADWLPTSMKRVGITDDDTNRTRFKEGTGYTIQYRRSADGIVLPQLIHEERSLRDGADGVRSRTWELKDFRPASARDKQVMVLPEGLSTVDADADSKFVLGTDKDRTQALVTAAAGYIRVARSADAVLAMSTTKAGEAPFFPPHLYDRARESIGSTPPWGLASGFLAACVLVPALGAGLVLWRMKRRAS